MSDGRRVDSLDWRQMHLNIAPIHTDRMCGDALVTHGLYYLPSRTGAGRDSQRYMNYCQWANFDHMSKQSHEQSM